MPVMGSVSCRPEAKVDSDCDSIDAGGPRPKMHCVRHRYGVRCPSQRPAGGGGGLIVECEQHERRGRDDLMLILP